MMNYIGLDDIQDSFLKVTEQDIEQANLYVGDIAKRKGVDEDSIVIPISYTVKRLAICFACYNSCLSSVGTDPITTFDGGSREDTYAQKLELYKKEIDEILDKLTEADFTGKKAGGSCIGLWRA